MFLGTKKCTKEYARTYAIIRLQNDKSNYHPYKRYTTKLSLKNNHITSYNYDKFSLYISHRFFASLSRIVLTLLSLYCIYKSKLKNMDKMKKTLSFIFRLDKKTRDKLEALSKQENITKAKVITRLINNANTK